MSSLQEQVRKETAQLFMEHPDFPTDTPENVTYRTPSPECYPSNLADDLSSIDLNQNM